MIIDKCMTMTLADWKQFKKTCDKNSGPYWILQPDPNRVLTGLEIEYAKLVGGAAWDEWRAALRPLERSRNKETKAFAAVWLRDIHDAQHHAWGGGEPYMTISHIAWPDGRRRHNVPSAFSTVFGMTTER